MVTQWTGNSIQYDITSQGHRYVKGSVEADRRDKGNNNFIWLLSSV